jgi:hypothetical protein
MLQQSKPQFDKPFFRVGNDTELVDLETFVSTMSFDYFEWAKDKNSKPLFRIMLRGQRVATGVCRDDGWKGRVDSILVKHEKRPARAP